MATFIELTGAIISDPEGGKVGIAISLRDDAFPDTRGEPTIFASTILYVDAFPNTQQALDQITALAVAWGTRVKAALVSRNAFLQAVPPGTRVPIA